MANLDESVRNLERFLSQLETATGELEQVAQGLAAVEKELAQLEDEGRDSGLDDRLEDFAPAVESEASDAREAVEELRDAADAALGAVSEAQTARQDSVEAVERSAQDAGQEMDEAWARLAEHGFQSLARAAEEVEHELETARAGAAVVTDELVDATSGLEQEAESAWSQADESIDRAVAGVDVLESSLAAAATEAAQGLSAEAETMEAACSSLEGELKSIYEALAERTGSERHAFSDALQAAAQEAARHVEAARQERLETRAAADGAALDLFGLELDRLDAALAAASPLAEALPPLTSDLGRCQAIVRRIDELLQAMAG